VYCAFKPIPAFIAPLLSHSPATNEPAYPNLAVVASPSVQVHPSLADAIERKFEDVVVTGL